MEYLDIIIKIAAAIGAIVAIWRAVVFFVHMADALKKIQEHTLENYKTGLRLTVMNDNMPLGERIIDGDDYIKAGGNGEVKHYIEDVLHSKDKIKSEAKENEEKR